MSGSWDSKAEEQKKKKKTAEGNDIAPKRKENLCFKGEKALFKRLQPNNNLR